MTAEDEGKRQREPFDPDGSYTTADTFDPANPPNLPEEHMSASKLAEEQQKVRELLAEHGIRRGAEASRLKASIEPRQR